MPEDLVQEVRGRFEHGESQKSIAERMGIDNSQVSRIVRRKTWTEVP